MHASLELSAVSGSCLLSNHPSTFLFSIVPSKVDGLLAETLSDSLHGLQSPTACWSAASSPDYPFCARFSKCEYTSILLFFFPFTEDGFSVMYMQDFSYLAFFFVNFYHPERSSTVSFFAKRMRESLGE